MRRALVLIGVVLACFWLRGGLFSTAVAPAAAARKFTPAPVADSRDVGPRVVFAPGHYPQLQGGEPHHLHSILHVAKPMAFGDYVWNDTGVPPGSVWVRIDLARQMLSVFRGDDEIGTAVIIYGANDHPTPVGVFPILQKSPYYYSHSYDAPMPYALRLTADGVALHASLVREHRATHGCIGLPLEFAHLLYTATSKGDRVEILPDNAST